MILGLSQRCRCHFSLYLTTVCYCLCTNFSLLSKLCLCVHAYLCACFCICGYKYICRVCVCPCTHMCAYVIIEVREQSYVSFLRFLLPFVWHFVSKTHTHMYLCICMCIYMNALKYHTVCFDYTRLPSPNSSQLHPLPFPPNFVKVDLYYPNILDRVAFN